MHLIIGTNRISKSIIKHLESSGEEVNTWEADIDEDGNIDRYEDFLKLLDRTDYMILLLKDFEKMLKFLETAKEEDPELQVLCYNRREEYKSFLEDERCDLVFTEEEAIKGELLEHIRILGRKKKNHELVKKILSTGDEISIFIHDNPDPDAIASAKSFEKICNELNKKFKTYYSGELGFPENKIFVKSTGFDMEKISEADIDEIIENSGLIVFIDFARPGKNNIVPERFDPDIVIDHHQTNLDYDVDGFVEITTDVGATSTIMAQFLIDFNIDIEPTLASALVYGIKVDTRDFTKNIGEKDFEILSNLMTKADKELLEVFESPPMEPHTLDSLALALSERKVEDEVVTAYAGEVETRDDIPQIVDIMAGERDIMTALVYGLLDDKLYMSARSKDISLNLGEKMEKAFLDIGQAGGHKHAAGGSIPLDKFDDIEEAIKMIDKKFREGVY